MQTISQILLAGQPWVLNVPNNFLQLVTAPAALDIRFMSGGRVQSEAEDVLEGFYCKLDGFDRIELISPVDQLVKVILSDGSAGSNRIAGEVSATVRGGSTVLNKPMISAIGATEKVVCTARADRVAVRVLNSGTTNVALLAPGGNYTDAVIVLAPGEMWLEETAPAAAWVAISDAAGGVLKVQELIL